VRLDRRVEAGSPSDVEAPADADDATIRRAGIRWCVGVFLAVRGLLSLVAFLGVSVLPNGGALSPDVRAGAGVPSPVDVPGWPAPPVTRGPHNLVTAWERQDALWYLRIADAGYRTDDGSAAFFPLYPMMIRVLSFPLGGHPLAASLLVSNAAFLGALIVLYLLGRSEMDERRARRAVVYTAVFPAAVFFLAPYSESLFLLLALVTFWGARRGRWWVAGLAGAGAALTRNVGVILALPIAIEAVQQWADSRPAAHAPNGAERTGPRSVVPGLVAAIGPVVGLGAYLAFWAVRSGDWLATVRVQANWERTFTNPIVTLVRGTGSAFRWNVYPGGFQLLDWLIAVPVLAGVVWAVVRLRSAYWSYAVVAVIIPLSYAWDGRPLMSFPRFAVVVFPIFWAFATWTRRSEVAHAMAVASSAVLLGIMTLLFAGWYYVF
jgi:hypothetical protein